MWIRKVVARAFGPFEGEELELAAGMNVICGPNESGKSTWHGAFYAALCGIRRGRGRARLEDQEFEERHHPWYLERWEVSAVLELSDGRGFELHYDLAGKVDSRITDLGTGNDVSSEYMYDGAPDGSKLLGLNREIVPSTIFVRQAEILAVTEKATSLQDQLQRAAATSGNDATAEEALGLLDQFRKDHVGSEVRHSTKPLRKAIVAVDKCERELDSARRQHEEYVQLLQAAQDAELEAEEATARLEAARAFEAKRELEELASRLSRAEEIADNLPAQRPPERRANESEVEELRDAVAAFRGRPSLQPLPEGRSAAAIGEELQALPERPQSDTEVHDSVSEALDELKNRRVALDTARSDPVPEPEAKELEGTSPSDLRHLADELETPLPEVDPELIEQLEQAREAAAKRRMSVPGVVGGVSALVGIGLLVAGVVAVGAALAVVGFGLLVLAVFQRRGAGAVPPTQLETRVAVQEEAKRQAEARRQKATARVQELGLPKDANELRRLAHRTENAETEKERYEQWKVRVERLEAAADQAQIALRSALEDRGVAQAGDVGFSAEELVGRYRQQCRLRSEQARLADRRGHLESELKARQATEQAWEESKRQRAKAEARLESAVEAVGIEVGEFEDLAQAAEEWLEEEEVRETRNREIRERFAELDGVLRGGSLDELRAEVARLEENLPALPDDLDRAGGEKLVAALPELERAAKESARSADELRGRAQDRAQNIPNVAVAEEAYEQAEQELERVRRLDRVLDRTHQFLGNARERVQRAIAPRLVEAVERYLPSVTDGHYTESLVDADSLTVKVRDRQGHWREAGLLSHGTTEQVYLLLRVGLAEFVATTGEPAPLILDDVTVQCDSTRTVAVLEMLLELSRERQIVVFSQEQEVLEWAQERLRGERHRLIELSGLAAAQD